MKYCKLIILWCSYFPIIYTQPQHSQERLPRHRTYDVFHYKLDLVIDEKKKNCRGDVSIELVPLPDKLDTVELDAAGLDITKIQLGFKSLNFRTEDDKLLIALDRPYSFSDTLNLTISYSVTSPKKGLYFISPDSSYPKKQIQIWSQGAPEENHYWFPCYDFPNDRATSEMVITVNKCFSVIGNGQLLSRNKNSSDNMVTYHWFESKPHVSYLISLIVGEYIEVKDAYGTVPISNYVYKHQEADAMRSFGKTPKMMEFFTSRISYPYPWEKYSQTVVSDFIFGGMENVSAVTLSDNTIHDSRAHLDYSSDDLVAHELAHQWFGDLITCRDWSHAWLNEGFATYFENLFIEYDRGKDDAAKKIMDYQISLRNIDEGDRRRPTVWNRYINPMDLFDNRIYGKGAVILSMLRGVLGDDLFWTAIKNYVNKYAFQCVVTQDFKSVVEEAANSDLDWFFDQWVYKAGCPEFEVTTKWDQATRSLNLIVKQIQNIDSMTGIFQTPVDIEIWIRGNPETYRIMVTKVEETFSIPTYQQPQLVIFDKGSKVLKKIRFGKSVDEWIYQLQRATDGVDRLQAIDELRWYVDKDTVIKVLSRTALYDPFWAVRQEAVWTLGESKISNIADTLVIAYGDRDSRIRAASISSLGRFKGEKVLKILKHAFEKDSSYSVAAAALRSLTQVDTANRKMYCNEGLKYNSRNDIIQVTSLQLLAEDHDDEALKSVWTFSGYGFEPTLRLHAIRLLVKYWKERDDVLYYLIRLMNDPSFHVRRTVVEILGEIGNKRALDPLQTFLQSNLDERLEKAGREAIMKIQLINNEKK